MAKTTELPLATPVAADEVVGNASGVTSRFTVTGLKAAMALANVENTALSTWGGSANITSLGTIASGVWNGTPIVSGYISDAAITAAKIMDAAVGASKIAAGAVGTSHLADNAVTLAKMATLAQDTLLGRYSAGVGIPQAITIGEGLSLDSSGVLTAIGGSGGGGSGTFSIGSGGGSAPELAPAVTGGTWSQTGTGAGEDATGLLFTNANNLAASFVSADLKDSTTYDVLYTVEGYTGGQHRVLLYGDTLGQVGSSADQSGNGTFTTQITTGAGSGSQTNQIRIQATGSSGTNNFKVTAVSVREAGAGSYPTRAMSTKIKEMEISVIDFGADPTGVGDSTAAFEDAIAYGVRRIKVPEGEYNVTNLIVNQNIELHGEGRGVTIINVTGSGNIHGMKIEGNAALGRSNKIGVFGIELRYEGSGQTVAGSGPGQNNWSGIYIQRKVIMEDVYVRDFTNDGIYFAPSDANEATLAGGTIDEAVFFARLVDVWSKYNGRDGIAVRRGANANNFWMCQFSNNDRHGFHHYTDGFATYGNTIRDGQASYNHDHGWYFENGTNIITSGLYCELNGYSGGVGYAVAGMKDVWVGDNCTRSRIEIGVLYNQDTSTVRLPFNAAWGTSTGGNTAQIQVWEGGRRGYGAT